MAVKFVKYINILDREITSSSGNIAEKVYLDTTDYDGTVLYYFEIVAKISVGSGSVYFQDSSNNADGTITVSAATYTRYRSAAMTVATDTYHININSILISVKSARIVIVQSDASAITDTELQAEIGDYEANKTGAADATDYPLTYPKYFYYDSSKFDGTLSFEAHLTWMQNNDKTTATFKLEKNELGLAYIDVEDHGGTYVDVWGDGTYIYCACYGSGIRSYSVDGSGNLVNKDTDYQGGLYWGVWGDGTYLYVACGLDGIRSYSVDGSGNFTYIDVDDQGDDYREVWGDGNFIYAACYGGGIRSYSVDGSGNLTYIDGDDQGGSYWRVWGDGNFIYALALTSGIHSYSVDGSGNLTYIDTDYQGGSYIGAWGDGTYLYVACGLDGIRSYSVDGSGNFTYIDVDDQGNDYYDAWSDGTYIYCACYDDGIRSYLADASGNLTYIDVEYQGDYYYSVWGDGTYIYCACGSDGIRSYNLEEAFNLWTDVATIYSGSGTDGVVVFTRYTTDFSANMISGRNYRLVWQAADAKYGDVTIYNAKLVVKQTDASEITKTQTILTLLNSETVSDTGLQDCDGYYDADEWDGVTVNIYPEHDASGASSNTKLQEDTDDTASDVANSSITGANRQRGATALSITDNEDIDTNIVTA